MSESNDSNGVEPGREIIVHKNEGMLPSLDFQRGKNDNETCKALLANPELKAAMAREIARRLLEGQAVTNADYAALSSGSYKMTTAYGVVVKNIKGDLMVDSMRIEAEPNGIYLIIDRSVNYAGEQSNSAVGSLIATKVLHDILNVILDGQNPLVLDSIKHLFHGSGETHSRISALLRIESDQK